LLSLLLLGVRISEAAHSKCLPILFFSGKWLASIDTSWLIIFIWPIFNLNSNRKVGSGAFSSYQRWWISPVALGTAYTPATTRTRKSNMIYQTETRKRCKTYSDWSERKGRYWKAEKLIV
jgi:hypothetical protein